MGLWAFQCVIRPSMLLTFVHTWTFHSGSTRCSCDPAQAPLLILEPATRPQRDCWYEEAFEQVQCGLEQISTRRQAVTRRMLDSCHALRNPTEYNTVRSAWGEFWMVVDETRRPRQAANHNDSDQWERAQPLNKPTKFLILRSLDAPMCMKWKPDPARLAEAATFLRMKMATAIPWLWWSGLAKVSLRWKRNRSPLRSSKPCLWLCCIF